MTNHGRDYTPLGINHGPIRPISDTQRAAWVREVEARIEDRDERDELVAMVIGEVPC